MKVDNMFRNVLAAVLAVSSLVACAQVPTYTEQAQVLSVYPQYKRVPNFSQTYHQIYNPNGAMPGELTGDAVVGAVIGGVIGNQIGNGNGRAAATAAGAVIGAMQGQRNSGNYRPPYCTTATAYTNQFIGYMVTYEFQGRRYQQFMDYHPGEYVTIQVMQFR